MGFLAWFSPAQTDHAKWHLTILVPVGPQTAEEKAVEHKANSNCSKIWCMQLGEEVPEWVYALLWCKTVNRLHRILLQAGNSPRQIMIMNRFLGLLSVEQCSDVSRLMKLISCLLQLDGRTACCHIYQNECYVYTLKTNSPFKCLFSPQIDFWIFPTHCHDTTIESWLNYIIQSWLLPHELS